MCTQAAPLVNWQLTREEGRRVSILRLFEAIRRPIRQLTRLEWVVIAVIVSGLMAILLPQIQSAASGDIDLPVRILVFDASTGRAIAGAKVAIVNGPRWSADASLYEPQELPSPGKAEFIASKPPLTRADGTVTITHRFSTNSSDRNPVALANLARGWVIVLADGYGGITVPVCCVAMPTPRLRELQELQLPIGLFPLSPPDHE